MVRRLKNWLALFERIAGSIVMSVSNHYPSVYVESFPGSRVGGVCIASLRNEKKEYGNMYVMVSILA